VDTTLTAASTENLLNSNCHCWLTSSFQTFRLSFQCPGNPEPLPVVWNLHCIKRIQIVQKLIFSYASTMPMTAVIKRVECKALAQLHFFMWVKSHN